MVINNHRRIDQLEEQVASEQARVRFLEDFSDQLGGKVRKLEKSMDVMKKEVSKQKKSLITILTLVKLISNHQTGQRNNSKIVSMLKSGAMSVLQNAVVFGIIQMIMKITWLDSLIDSLTELLRFSNIFTKKSVERSRFLVKLSISITLFVLLRGKIKSLLMKLKEAITFIGSK